jgi:prevent-host-death family protein
MEKATISQLKNRLSEYLRKVRSGATVLILDRDQPVARLEGLASEEMLDQRLVRLERKGLLKCATGRPPKTILEESSPTPSRSILEALIEERRGGR